MAPAGDRALLVTLGTAIDPALLGEVLALDRALQQQRPAGLLGTIPAYASLLCRYDPAIANLERLVNIIGGYEGRLSSSIPASTLVDVPTRYDGADLAHVADVTGLSPAAVVDLHTDHEYLVYCVGFAPGFTYCGRLPEPLRVPRLASPRLRVPAGSVGIAGEQTGIYAVDSPGGWNLLGRTELVLFDATANPPVRFRPGDRLRFIPDS
jgi:inhibitor of KinA